VKKGGGGISDGAGGALAGGVAGVAATYAVTFPLSKRIVNALKSNVAKIHEAAGLAKDNLLRIKLANRDAVEQADAIYYSSIRGLMEEGGLAREAAEKIQNPLLQMVNKIKEKADHFQLETSQKWAKIDTDSTIAVASLEEEAKKFTNYITRPKAVWNHMSYKGKTAIGVGITAVTIGAAIVGGRLINKWRNGSEAVDFEDLSHVQRHNYRHIGTRLNNQQAGQTL
jgi:hypothetical protein